MAKKNAWNTVTPLSKFLAFILFITLPFIGFYFGMQYQKELDDPLMQDVVAENEQIPPVDGSEVTACTMDVRVCPDGTAVGRSGPNCEFEKCPGE